MIIYNRRELDQHYHRILEQNRDKILAGGTGDAYLLSPDSDTRMSLVLVIRITPQVSQNICSYLQEIKALEPDLYYYPMSDFHVTVLDILRGEPNRPIPHDIQKYIACIKECAGRTSPFEIAFDGVTMSDCAVLIKGYYEYALEDFRQRARQKLREWNLVQEERYQTVSSHITVARIPRPLANPGRLLECLADKKPFGIIKVASIELVYHDWYDSKKTLISQFHLGGTPCLQNIDYKQP